MRGGCGNRTPLKHCKSLVHPLHFIPRKEPLVNTIPRTCLSCQVLFDAPAREVRRGNAKFCSLKCAGAYRHTNKVPRPPNAICLYCSEPFYRQVSHHNKTMFCCRSHKDLARRGVGSGKWSYRKLAFDNLPNECAVCGWDEYLEVLEVNHKDVDRSHNALDNLEILCPTHHRVFHFLDLSGPWG